MQMTRRKEEVVMKRLTTILCAVALLGTAQVWATPVDVPATALDINQETTTVQQTLAEEVPLEFWISAQGDWVTDRDIELGTGDTGELEIDFYGGKIGLSVMDRVDIYWGLYQGSNPEFNFQTGGSNVNFELDDELFWEAGINADLIEVPFEDLGTMSVFVDADYRTSLDDLEFENVKVGGTTYSSAELSDVSDVEWKEWQVALGGSFSLFDTFTPYAGVLYTDSKIEGTATAGATEYPLGDAENEDEFGAFVGASVSAGEMFALDLQARFVGETAYTVSGTFKF
jgi:hypothetical protein